MPPFKVPARPRFLDMTYEEAAEQGFDTVEIKWDGHLAFVLFDGEGHWTIYSRTSTLKERGRCHTSMPTALLVGELLVGTNWATRSESRGDLVLFTALELRGEWLQDQEESLRHNRLFEFVRSHRLLMGPLAGRVSVNTRYSIARSAELWARHVEAGARHEGLVFKRSESRWSESVGRQKRESEMDYVIVGVIDSDSTSFAGRGIKAFRLGLYEGEELKEVGQVGTMTEAVRERAYQDPSFYIGRVCTVRGRGVFPSGAMRHPSFVGLRDDKNPEDCVLTSAE